MALVIKDLITGITARGYAEGIFLNSFMSAREYPIWQRFLMVAYNHTPVRFEYNVPVNKIIQFRLYNPDSNFGIDLDTFKVRINKGEWIRYGDSKLVFTEISYREYKVYFNPPDFDYDSNIEVEVYCEDDFNNPGIKLEIL